MRPTYNLVIGLSLVVFCFAFSGLVAGLLSLIVFVVASVVSAMLPIVAGSCRRGLGKQYEFVLEAGLPVSPFVEKVRWALDKLQVEYVEEDDYGVVMFIRGRSVPTLHYARKSHWSSSSMSNSTDILDYLAGRYAHTPAGEFLQHSAQGDALERKIDDLLELVRRFFYYHVLYANNGALKHMAPVLWGANEPHIPWWQKSFGSVLLPLQRHMLINFFRLSKVDRPALAKKIVDAITEFDSIVAGSANKTLLNTKSPNYVDHSLAIAIALAFGMDEYGGGACSESSSTVLFSKVTDFVNDLAPAAKLPIVDWARNMYRTQRTTSNPLRKYN